MVSTASAPKVTPQGRTVSPRAERNSVGGLEQTDGAARLGGEQRARAVKRLGPRPQSRFELASRGSTIPHFVRPDAAISRARPRSRQGAILFRARGLGSLGSGMRIDLLFLWRNEVGRAAGMHSTTSFRVARVSAGWPDVFAMIDAAQRGGSRRRMSVRKAHVGRGHL